MRDEQSVPKTWAEKAAEILADCEEGQFSEPAVIGRPPLKVVPEPEWRERARFQHERIH
jgi:hypothetical protein